MLNYFELKEAYGYVEYEGKEYALTQQAYPDGTRENPYYTASAIDTDGNEYIITWDLLDHQEDLNYGDECDWDNPASVTPLR